MTDHRDTAPGDENDGGSGIAKGIAGYAVGLFLAGGLTVASFSAANLHLLWGPALPVALLVLAVAQMGVHLVFFLHLGTGADHTNNILALAFGILIVALIMTGTLWIMAHMNQNMMG